MQRRVSRGLAVGDLFNDGQLDVVVEDIDGAQVILRNRGIAGHHWVSFELAGTKNDRLALGARVKLTAGGMTQTSDVRSGGSYLSQSDLRVHFGLRPRRLTASKSAGHRAQPTSCMTCRQTSFILFSRARALFLQTQSVRGCPPTE